MNIDVLRMTSHEYAARVPFAGSPTILLEGEDMFAGGAPTSDALAAYGR